MSVTKIMNDRFFEEKNRGLDNPKGIIVSNDVVKTGITNFFLIS